jgi:hypothetical protein
LYADGANLPVEFAPWSGSGDRQPLYSGAQSDSPQPGGLNRIMREIKERGFYIAHTSQPKYQPIASPPTFGHLAEVSTAHFVLISTGTILERFTTFEQPPAAANADASAPAQLDHPPVEEKSKWIRRLNGPDPTELKRLLAASQDVMRMNAETVRHVAASLALMRSNAVALRLAIGEARASIAAISVAKVTAP